VAPEIANTSGSHAAASSSEASSEGCADASCCDLDGDGCADSATVGSGSGASSSGKNRPTSAEMPQTINARITTRITTATMRRRRRICGGIRFGRGGSLSLSAMDNSLAILTDKQRDGTTMVFMSETKNHSDHTDVDKIRTRILDWYADNGRDLPWRRPDTTAWG